MPRASEELEEPHKPGAEEGVLTLFTLEKGWEQRPPQVQGVHGGLLTGF